MSNILAGYMDEDDKFNQLPGKRQKIKQEAMLLELAKHFAHGVEYSELEVNEILNQHHSFNDPATLRRLMFGKKILDRTLDGRVYRLIMKKTNLLESKA